MSSKSGVGDLVVALRPGGQDARRRPKRVPEPGGIYRITSVYRMAYGLGCTLEGMNPAPYRGFFLFVERGRNKGWYFRKTQQDSKPAEEGWLNKLLKEKTHELV